MPRRMTKTEIGNALANIRADVMDEIAVLVKQYRDPIEANPDDMITHAVDAPKRAKARLQEWITQYDSRHGAGTALVFLAECLTAAGSVETIATLNSQITALEAQSQTMVNNVNNSAWTLAQVADWMETNLPAEPDEPFTYGRMPVPAGYITIWGDPWY